MNTEDQQLEEQSPAAEPSRPAAHTPSPQAPSADQLTATRAAHWHQDGSALLSQSDLRDWLTRSGLVLYTPRPQVAAPAPSLVEATLGKANPEPTLVETGNAKSMLARLIAEGNAVPLNLLGTTGANGTDVPDFIVSAAVFSYIFTLRGNKAWKQSPVTSGPVKVSPLALAVYEVLAAKVMLSCADLTHQIGGQITEAGVLRALTELWSQLRVIPVPQQDGTETLWELATSRFTKQIKAGANAGQPSALSALISLYLGQAVGATEDEIESFLSPLAPRSRVREVVHALMAARQLETLVVGGKTLLHVAGDVPAFAVAAAPEPVAEGSAENGSRISTFTAKPGSKIASGLRSKPAFGKKPYGPRAEGERRPFKRDDSAARPSFNKPWDEDRKPRPAAGGSSAAESTGNEAPRRTFTPRTFTPRTDRPAFGAKPPFKPRFEGRSEGFSGGSNAAGDSRPPRRESTPRTEGEASRRTFSKPGTFGRKREGGFAGKTSFGDARPPRRDFGGSGGAGGSGGSGSSEARPPRRDFNASSSERGERPSGGGDFKRPGSYTPRPRGDFGGKPAFNGPKPGYQRDSPAAGSGEAPRKVFRKFDAPRDKKPFGAKPFGDRKPFTPGGSARPPRSFDAPRAFDKPRGERPSFGGGSGGSDRPRPSFGGGSGGADRPRPSFGGSSGGADRPRPSFSGGSGGSERSGASAKPGGFGAKKPSAKPGSFAGKGGPFAKFADGAKPFRKPGQKRPPFAGKPGGAGRAGGFAPSKRKRGDQ